MNGKKENIINRDFQGWPVYKWTLRDILTAFGAETMYSDAGGKHKPIIGFSSNDPILDICPRCFEDDGMGYGVNQTWISEAAVVTDAEGKTQINLFREVEDGNAKKIFEDEENAVRSDSKK